MTLSFVQLPAFVKGCARLGIDDVALCELEMLFLHNPQAGDVMSGTGGLRKVTFAPSKWNRGKSGATRVCYVFVRTASTIYLVDVFAKNEQDNLNAGEKAVVRKLVERIQNAHRQ